MFKEDELYIMNKKRFYLVSFIFPTLIAAIPNLKSVIYVVITMNIFG